MSIKKSIVYTGIATIISIVVIAAAPHAEAVRIRAHGSGSSVNANDVKVVNAFTDTYEDFVNQVAGTSANTTPNLPIYETLKTNNETLQKHGFKSLNDEYTKSANDIKQHANTIVEKSGVVNSSPLANVTQTVRELNDEMRSYNTAITAMTSAVEKYTQDKKAATDRNNQTVGYVIAGIVGVIVLAIVWGIIAGRRSDNKNRKILFSNDPSAATTIPVKDQKTLARVYEYLMKYEKAYLKSDKINMDVARKVGYDPYQQSAAKESLGKYRSLIFEFAALIALSNNNSEHAKTMLDRAESYLGSRQFYTETARNTQK